MAKSSILDRVTAGPFRPSTPAAAGAVGREGVVAASAPPSPRPRISTVEVTPAHDRGIDVDAPAPIGDTTPARPQPVAPEPPTSSRPRVASLTVAEPVRARPEPEPRPAPMVAVPPEGRNSGSVRNGDGPGTAGRPESVDQRSGRDEAPSAPSDGRCGRGSHIAW